MTHPMILTKRFVDGKPVFMSAYPVIGFGSGNSALKVDDSGTGAAPGGTSTAFVFLESVELPGGEVEDVDVSGLWMATPDKQKIPGAYDNKTVKAKIRYCHADLVRLIALKGQANHVWKVQAPSDGVSITTATFNGFLKSFQAGPIEYDKVVDIDLEITISGAIAIA